MRKLLVLVVVALAVPSLALAEKPASPGKSQESHGKAASQSRESHGKAASQSRESHGKAAPQVLYVLKGTLTAFTAAGGASNGTVSILVRSANHHGSSLKGQTLAFAVSAATKVVTGKNAAVTVGDRGIVKVRGPKRLGATETLATVLQASTAKQVIDQGRAEGGAGGGTIATNHPPVANPDTFGMNEDDAFVPVSKTLLLGNVFGNDTDADADPIHGSACSASPTLNLGNAPAFAGLIVTANDVSMTDSSGCSYTVTLGASSATVTVGLDGGVSLHDPNHLFDALGVGESIVLTTSYTIADSHGAVSTAGLSVTISGASEA